MSLALTAAAPHLMEALSKALLSTHTVDGGHMPDPAQNQATSVIDRVALNPQPLPPKLLGLNQFVNPGVAAAINPQPLPPRNFGQSQFVSPGAAVSLNPQPLPPGGGDLSGSKFAADDWCGTVPRTLPHFPPPPPGPWADVVSSALALRRTHLGTCHGTHFNS